jgi:AraC-like DNA-binding protein
MKIKSSCGDIVEKSDRAAVRRVKQQLHKAIRAFQEISEKIESGRMAVAALTPQLLAKLPSALLNPVLQEADFKKRSKAIKEGMQDAKNRGKRFGGARHKSQYRKRILQLAAREYTQPKIAQVLGCSQALVSKILQSRRKK